MKAYITIDGLFKGNEDDIGGVWMHKYFNPETRKYDDCYTWFELRAVKDLEDIKEAKRAKVNEMLWEYRKEGIKPPYVSISTELRYTIGEENSECLGTKISLSELENAMISKPDYIWLDMRPYTREGNPHDWSEWEPNYPEDVLIMEFLNKNQ